MTENFKQMISGSSFWQAEKIAGNDDLLREILIHLPVSSLACARCVSRQWLSIISDPDFRQLHSRQSSTATTGLFLFRKSDKMYHLDHLLNLSKTTNKKGVPYNISTFIERFKSVEPMHYCNGLLCLKLHLDNNNSNNNNIASVIPQVGSGYDRVDADFTAVLAGREVVSNKSPQVDNDEVIYCVYNPCTNGYTNIPLPETDGDDEIVSMNLGFDPPKSSNYKIVCIVRDKLGLFRFFIFSSDTTWKESGRVRGEFYYGRGVFLNGVIYFVSKHSHFMSFDLDNESLEIVPCTSIPEGRNGRKIKYFGESAGKLHVIEENVLRPTLLNVFELEKDYSKWFMKYVVDLDDLTRLFPLMVINEPESLDVIGYQFDVLCFVDGEKEGKTMLVLSFPEKMISYDIKNMSIKELLKVPLEELHLSMEGFLVYNYKWYHAYKHVETFALV